MSSLSKMLVILELFSPPRMVWTTEGICEALGYSRPTGYRYIRQLTENGLLVRVGPAGYSLGPRIVEWDFLMRHADPMLTAGLPFLRNLAVQTGCDINLVALYGDRIVTTHQEMGTEILPLSFSRGRPFPILRGASSRIIIANFPRGRLKRIYEQNESEALALGYGSNWEEFKSYLAKIKRAGYAVSRGELDAGYAGVAVPIFGPKRVIIGCIVAALTTQRLALTRTDMLVNMLQGAAKEIEVRIPAPQVPPVPRRRDTAYRNVAS